MTHGTTTLEYTAFLADLFLDVDTPVVFTGAMRRADDADSDGPRNLRDAITLLDRSTVARELLGEEFVDHYLRPDRTPKPRRRSSEPAAITRPWKHRANASINGCVDRRPICACS